MNHQFKYIIKLPPISKLRSSSRKIDPYTKLYKYIIKEVYPNLELFYPKDRYGVPVIPGKELNVSAVWVTYKDDAKLFELEDEWCKMLGFGKGAAFYYHLDIGPASLDRIDKEHKSGFLYITKDLLIRK